MKSRFYLPLLGCAALLTALVCAPPVGAQQDAAEKGAGKKAAEQGGPLPPFYAEVLTEEQRQQVYKIQAEYGAKIAEVRELFAKLNKEKKEKIDAVPTAEQKQKIAQLMADATKRKAEAAAERRKKTGAGTRTPKPGTPAR
jgi:hypothetical protein